MFCQSELSLSEVKRYPKGVGTLKLLMNLCCLYGCHSVAVSRFLKPTEERIREFLSCFCFHISFEWNLIMFEMITKMI